MWSNTEGGFQGVQREQEEFSETGRAVSAVTDRRSFRPAQPEGGRADGRRAVVPGGDSDGLLFLPASARAPAPARVGARPRRRRGGADGAPFVSAWGIEMKG